MIKIRNMMEVEKKTKIQIHHNIKSNSGRQTLFFSENAPNNATKRSRILNISLFSFIELPYYFRFPSD